MAWTAQGGTATATNGSATVAITAPFESNLIAVGAGFAIPGEVEYEITATNAAAGTITISPAYAGSTKTAVSFWVKPYPGAVRAAEASLRSATEAIELIAAPSATDRTAGRLLRVGDLGYHGQAIELGAGNDLNDVVQEGIYTWTTGNTPLNSPNTTGSHVMRVMQGVFGVNVIQEVYRHTQAQSNLVRYWRNIFTSDDEPDVTPWVPEYNRYNALGTVAFTSGVPTGALAFTASGTYTVGGISSPYWVKRTFEGWQELQIEVPVDVTDDTAQVIEYPEDYSFASGGKTFGSLSHTVTTPNAALLLTNVDVLASYNTSLYIKLNTAGTSADSSSNAEKLRFQITGRWA